MSRPDFGGYLRGLTNPVRSVFGLSIWGQRVQEAGPDSRDSRTKSEAGLRRDLMYSKELKGSLGRGRRGPRLDLRPGCHGVSPPQRVQRGVEVVVLRGRGSEAKDRRTDKGEGGRVG